MSTFDYNWVLIANLCLSFLICFRSIPAIVHIAREKKLYDEPNHRSSHVLPIPSLGGVAIFFAFSISSLIFTGTAEITVLNYLLVAIIIMFGAGIKDDILIISASKKFILQFFSASVLVFLGDVRILSLDGFLGIYELNYLLSCLFSLVLIVYITNSINLIDGIDGLSSGITMLVCMFFGVWFYRSNFAEMAVIATATFGSAAAFFIRNVFGKKSKIFMGDTGSLIIGMIISVVVIKFLEFNSLYATNNKIENAIVVALAVLVIPFYDTLRVFSLRILKGGSPFKADKNHLHHNVIALGFSHRCSTFILICINLSIIVLSLNLHLSIEFDIVILFALMTLFVLLLKFFKSNTKAFQLIEKFNKTKIH